MPIPSKTDTHRSPGSAGVPRNRPQIDPRGPRFAATLTTGLLAVALVAAPSPLTTGLLAAQAVVFGIGAVAGVRRTPYAWLFRALVRPRLGAPQHLEDAAPPRFAQAVGLAFAVVALAGFVAGVAALGEVATALALVAALLNAAFGFCLGCEGYLLLRRAFPARGADDTGAAHDHRAAQPTAG